MEAAAAGVGVIQVVGAAAAAAGVVVVVAGCAVASAEGMTGSCAASVGDTCLELTGALLAGSVPSAWPGA